MKTNPTMPASLGPLGLPFNFWTSFALLRRIEARNFENDPVLALILAWQTRPHLIKTSDWVTKKKHHLLDVTNVIG